MVAETRLRALGFTFSLEGFFEGKMLEDFDDLNHGRSRNLCVCVCFCFFFGGGGHVVMETGFVFKDTRVRTVCKDMKDFLPIQVANGK